MSKYKLNINLFVVSLSLIMSIKPVLSVHVPLELYGDLEYRVQKSDSISLYCHKNGEKVIFFERIPVLPNGSITIPYWGETPIRGLTVSEFNFSINTLKPEPIKDKIDKCDTVIFHPEVKIPVIGHVRNPGYYPVQDSTVYDMIGAAGGFSFLGDQSEVKVIRQRKDGTREDFIVDFRNDVYHAYAKGSGVGQAKYIVHEGDIIYVRRSNYRTILKGLGFILQAATLGLVSGFTAAALN